MKRLPSYQHGSTSSAPSWARSVGRAQLGAHWARSVGRVLGAPSWARVGRAHTHPSIASVGPLQRSIANRQSSPPHPSPTLPLLILAPRNPDEENGGKGAGFRGKHLTSSVGVFEGAGEEQHARHRRRTCVVGEEARQNRSGGDR